MKMTMSAPVERLDISTYLESGVERFRLRGGGPFDG
jgi:hypothetical protein